MAEYSPEPVGIGIVGCGVIGPAHARALRDHPFARLIAVADVDAAAAQKVAAEFNVRAYASAQQLIEDSDIDGVILALPANLRLELGAMVFRAGKHLLTEKPVARNAGEVRTLLQAQGNLIGACCSSRFRFSQTAERAREFVASGELGELRSVHCRVLVNAGASPLASPPRWRLSREQNGGGILMNWGCYDFDFLLGILDWQLQPRRVLAQTFGVAAQLSDRAAPGSDAETHVVAHISCEYEGRNIPFSYERAEFYAGPPCAVWQIGGTRGTLDMAMTSSGEDPLVFHEAPSTGGVVRKVLLRDPEQPGSEHAGPASDFARAIAGSTPVRTSLENALVIAKISDAIYASAEAGHAVEILQ